MSLPSSSAFEQEGSRGPGTILCYVTDRRSLPVSSRRDSSELLLEKVERATAAGIDWVQIREKDLSGKALSELVRNAVKRAAQNNFTRDAAARILVNDRVDIALAEGAHGTHLGENSLPIEEAKRLSRRLQEESGATRDFLVGASCHSLQGATAAEKSGADYVIFGPIFATPSKAAYGSAQGLGRLAEVCAAVRIPVLAIGGIALENMAECISAGAAGIAGIRLFQDAADLDQFVKEIRDRSGWRGSV